MAKRRKDKKEDLTLISEKLSAHFHEDKSALVKKSLHELYDNILDLDEIKKYELKERKGKTLFYTAEDILKS